MRGRDATTARVIDCADDCDDLQLPRRHGHDRDDDVLALFVARADHPAALAAAVRERVGDLADRVCMVADSTDPAALAPVAQALRA